MMGNDEGSTVKHFFFCFEVLSSGIEKKNACVGSGRYRQSLPPLFLPPPPGNYNIIQILLLINTRIKTVYK